ELSEVLVHILLLADRALALSTTVGRIVRGDVAHDGDIFVEVRSVRRSHDLPFIEEFTELFVYRHEIHVDAVPREDAILRLGGRRGLDRVPVRSHGRWAQRLRYRAEPPNGERARRRGDRRVVQITERARVRLWCERDRQGVAVARDERRREDHARKG